MQTVRNRLEEYRNEYAVEKKIKGSSCMGCDIHFDVNMYFPAAKTYAAAVNITNVEVTEVSAAGYRVTAKIGRAHV